jgi:hypothetical protein
MRIAAHEKVHSDNEIWSIVAFVERLSKMSEEQYGKFASGASPIGTVAR